MMQLFPGTGLILIFAFMLFLKETETSEYNIHYHSSFEVAKSTCTTIFATCEAECTGGINTSAHCEGTDLFPLCICKGGEEVNEALSLKTDKDQETRMDGFRDFLKSMESEHVKPVLKEIIAIKKSIEMKNYRAYIRHVELFNNYLNQLTSPEAETVEKWIKERKESAY